jgi:hypothetical protein
MTGMPDRQPRPDIDIEQEIGQIVNSYPPLKGSRGYFAYRANNGRVTLVGNVRTPQARRVLVDNVPRIAGVESVDSSQLYDDEMLRFAVGALLPPGVFASVHYGAVGLTGRVPDDASATTIIYEVGQVLGVRRVGAELSGGTNAPAPVAVAQG